MRRDERLGAALRELPVPEHGPEFAAELRRRLDDAGPLTRQEAGSAGPARRRSRRRARRPRLAIGGGLATALAVLVAGFLLLTPDDDGRAPGGLGAAPATAAQLGARVGDALARIETLQALLVVTERPAPDQPLSTTRYRLLRTSAGDERLTQLGGGEEAFDRAYAARAGVRTDLADQQVAPGVRVDGTVARGVAPGPPDAPLGDPVVQQQLGGVARALRAAGAARAEAVRDGGRPAWRISVSAERDVHALAGDTGDRVELTIDRRTGLPLRVRETYRGALMAERRLERLRLDAPIPQRLFAPTVAPASGGLNAYGFETDDGFRRGRLAAARAVVGYAPLVPRWLPSGFAAAETATGVAPAVTTGPEGLNPPSRDVVSTAYRRGLDTVIVTTRRAGGADWQDPVAVPEGFLVRPRRACFRTGALAGRCGELTVGPRAIPHLWAVADGLVVTVAGDLTQGELERVAASLAPLR